jgi:hypothetical protein
VSRVRQAAPLNASLLACAMLRRRRPAGNNMAKQMYNRMM